MTYISRFRIGIWVQKCSGEAVEGAIKLGRWKCFSDLHRHFSFRFPATRIVIAMWSLFHLWGTKGNGLQPTYIQQLPNLSKAYPLLSIILLFSLHEFCDIFQSPYYASKHKIIYSHTLDEDAEKFGDPADCYSEIIPHISFEQTLHFFFCADLYMKCMWKSLA